VEAEEEGTEATELVTGEVRSKKVNDEAVQRVVELAILITVPASSVAREDAAEATQQVIEAAAVVQELAASEAEVMAFVGTAEANEGNAGTSEATESQEAPEGKSDALNTNIDIVELGSSSDTRTNSPSSSSSYISSSDEDDVPLSKVYSSINKTTSTSTKTTQKPDDTFEPMYPSVQERMIDMQQIHIDACKYLPADHPLQPPVIEAIPLIPVAKEGASDLVGTYLASESNVSSKPNSPTNHNIDTSETSILSNLESHYSGELPGYVSNQHIAFDIASDEVIIESPQHQAPNSPINNFAPTSEILVPEQTTFEQSAPEQNASEQIASDQNASELTA